MSIKYKEHCKNIVVSWNSIDSTPLNVQCSHWEWQEIPQLVSTDCAGKSVKKLLLNAWPVGVCGQCLRNNRADVVPHLPYSLSFVLCCCLKEKWHSLQERLQQHGVTQTDVSWWHLTTSPAHFHLKKHTRLLYLFSATHSKYSREAREPPKNLSGLSHSQDTHTQMALVSSLSTVQVVLAE